MTTATTSGGGEELFTAAQLAERWNCSRAFIYQLTDPRRAGLRLRCIRIGSAVRVSASDAKAYLEEARNQ